MSTTTTPVTNINFSTTQPAAPVGQQNIVWNADGSGDISGYLPPFVGDSGTGGTAGSVPAPASGAAQAGKFLKANGTWEVPAGSVTSVGVSAPASLLTVTGSPVTSSGTVALALATQGPNLVFAGPASGTASAMPTFRALTAADLPAGISGTTVALETNGTANTSQTKLNLANGANITLISDTAGDVTVALNPTVNVTTVNTTSVSASGAVSAASFSASGDITTATSHTGAATVSGIATINTVDATYLKFPDGSTQTSGYAGQGVLLDVSSGFVTPQALAGFYLGPTFATVPFYTVNTDTANAFNTSTYAYTIPVTGTYLIVTKLRPVDNATAGLSYGQGFGLTTQLADGPTFSWFLTVPNTPGRNGSINTRVMHLTAGSQVCMFAYADDSIEVWLSGMNIALLSTP